MKRDESCGHPNGKGKKQAGTQKTHWANSLQLGHHVCCLFDENETLQASLAHFVANSLQTNARVVVICLDNELAEMVKSGKPHFEPQSRAAVEAALVSLGIKELECGRLLFPRTCEATKVIRSLCSGRPHAPKIFALTASVSESVKRQCMQAGMDGHISKPLKLKELVAALASA